MCSACSGDYENPDMTNGEAEELLTDCPHTDEVRWEPTYGQFVCLRCLEKIDIPELTQRDQDVALQL